VAGGGADIDIEGLRWRPARRRTPVLDGLDLHIPAGQRVIVVGPSGAGKSTLLRAIAGLLLAAGHGELSGRVEIAGRSVGDGTRTHTSVGLLLQDPQAGVVAETVGRDVAFGLENERVPREQIWPRVATALSQTGLAVELGHPTATLSGGEQQRVALAGSLVLGSRVTLLDEPTSMLDDEAAESVREAVRHDVASRGSTLVVVEHRLEGWLDFADRLVVMGRDGSVVADGPPREVLRHHAAGLAAQGVWVPGLGAPQPLAIDAALLEPFRPATATLVRADDVRVDLRAGLTGSRRTRTVLASVDACISAGRVLAVTGPSGAGKSTLVSVLAGLLRPTGGTVEAASELAVGVERRPWRWRSTDLVSRLSWVPQLPEHGVVARTVEDEVMASSRSCGRDQTWTRRRADGLLEILGLDHLRATSPYHLSGGEQRRLMVAASLAHGPSGVLFDEPTVGQDRLTWSAVVGVAASARSAGAGIAVASHDALATAALADETLRLQGGVRVA
jgi:energy-coupling factor transport system permease/ATP-binding protein